MRFEQLKVWGRGRYAGTLKLQTIHKAGDCSKVQHAVLIMRVHQVHGEVQGGMFVRLVPALLRWLRPSQQFLQRSFLGMKW